jgi:hypothetical protein
VRTVLALAAPITAGALAFFCWVVVPPFPPPNALVGVTYPDLVAKVGPPSGHLPGKFFAWTAGRWVGSWELRVDGFIPETPQVSLFASRCFFLGTQQRSKRLWCSWADVYLVADRKRLDVPVDGSARPLTIGSSDRGVASSLGKGGAR